MYDSIPSCILTCDGLKLTFDTVKRIQFNIIEREETDCSNWSAELLRIINGVDRLVYCDWGLGDITISLNATKEPHNTSES